MRRFDMVEVSLVGIVGAIIVFITMAIIGVAIHEVKHPCTKYGPERLAYMQKVGDILYPVYEKPCLERALEVAK